MTTFVVDLGFDWFAEPNDPTSPSQFELQWGVTIFPPSPAVPAAPNFQGGDTIAFNLFDITPVDSGQASPSGLTVQLGSPWLVAVPGDQIMAGTDMFNQASETAITNATIGTQTANRTSVIFGNTPTLNRWSVMSGGSPLSATVATVTGNPVCFLLTWTFLISANGIDKTFTVDPEMIVNP